MKDAPVDLIAEVTALAALAHVATLSPDSWTDDAFEGLRYVLLRVMVLGGEAIDGMTVKAGCLPAEEGLEAV